MLRFHWYIRALVLGIVAFRVATCSGEENDQKRSDADQHPINWEALTVLCDVVAVDENRTFPNECTFSRDPNTIATMVAWLKSNWDKFPTSIGKIDYSYKVHFVLPNLVTLDYFVFYLVDSSGKRVEHGLDTIVDFLNSPQNPKVTMPTGTSDGGAANTGEASNRKRSSVNQHPINWKAFEESSFIASVYENGKPYGRQTGKARNTNTWRDPKAGASLVSWLKSNWNRFPLSTELGDVAPSYKTQLVLRNGVTLELDVYTEFDSSSKRPVYQESGLDVLVDFLELPKHNHYSTSPSKESFGSSRRFP